MPVTIKAEPRRVVTWEEFKTFPHYSIALDGYCAGPSSSNSLTHHLNLNHHENDGLGGDAMVRLAMRSTCGQAIMLVKLGLFDEYQVDGKPHATLYVNDCDQDVAFATYVLKHQDVAEDKTFRELVRLEDYLDVSSGLYPVRRRSHVLRRLAWITEPYTRARLDGELSEMDEAAMLANLAAAHRRITSTLHGHGYELDLDTRYEVLSDHGSWTMVREIGAHARYGMSSDGIKAFVSVLPSRRRGRWRYSLARLSNFIPFPVGILCAGLNEAEGIPASATDRWGGGDTTGGPPREAGSSLPPSRLAVVIDDLLAKRAAAVGGP